MGQNQDSTNRFKERERELNNEWKDFLIFLCLLMNSHCIQGFGNNVHVPFMPIMHTGLKMKQKDERCARCSERGRAVVFNQNVASALDGGAVRWNKNHLINFNISVFMFLELRDRECD